ncbi:OsmC family protein [Balneolales bacterium ANBcel1]|nr:OsmC family protein [Balneolales bacterium ANBcel1]
MIKSQLKSEPKYLASITIDDHIQILDEPVSLGGTNQGPTPVQAVYSALAGCISMTLRMYAEKKNIPLGDIDVQIEASKQSVKEGDLRFEQHPQMIDKGKVRFIHAIVRVHGPLNDEQIEKLDAIAGKCPVHKMLKQSSWITHETLHAG